MISYQHLTECARRSLAIQGITMTNEVIAVPNTTECSILVVDDKKVLFLYTWGKSMLIEEDGVIDVPRDFNEMDRYNERY